MSRLEIHRARLQRVQSGGQRVSDALAAVGVFVAGAVMVAKGLNDLLNAISPEPATETGDQPAED